MASTDLINSTLQGFTDMLSQFLEACMDVWPEDTTISDYKLKLDLSVNQAVSPALKKAAMEKVINAYHKCLTPYYARCNQRDPTVFTETNIEMFEEVGLRQKWLDQGIDEDTREAVWEYVLELNRYAQLYSGLFSQIPSNTLGKIQETAMKMATKVQSGQMNLADLDLQQLGNDVVEDLDPKELEEFTQNIMADPSMLQNLCMSMMGTSGVDMGQMFQQAQGGGGGNAAAALAALQFLQQQ